MDAQPKIPLEMQFLILAKHYNISYTDFMLRIDRVWRLNAIEAVTPADENGDINQINDLMQ